MKIKISEGQYLIPRQNVEHLISLFEKVETKRQKLIEKGRIPKDFPEIKLLFDLPSDEIKDLAMNNKDLNGTQKRLLKSGLDNRNFYLTEVSNPQLPILNNWKVLGTLEKSVDESKYTMNSYNKNDPIPDKYRDTDPCQCDHCDHKRERNSTYILENKETNETLQVGSSCMKDFVSKETLDMLIFYSKSKQILDDYEVDKAKISNNNTQSIIDKRDFLAACNLMLRINNNKFVKASNSYPEKNIPSTYQGAIHLLDPYALEVFVNYKIRNANYYHQDDVYSSGLYRYKNFIEGLKIEEQDYKKVDELIEWYEKNPPTKEDNEMYFNMHSLVTSDSGFLYKKESGQVCYAISHMENIKNQKEIQLEKERISKNLLEVPTYIGEEKLKIAEMEVQLKDVYIQVDKTGLYGDSLVHIFSTRDDRTIKWKASNLNTLENLKDKNGFQLSCNEIKDKINESKIKDEGIWMKIKGTVISHEDFVNKKGENIKQTAINRAASITEVYTKPLEEGSVFVNDKFKLEQLKITNLDKGLSKDGTDIFKYSFEDSSGKNYFMFIKNKIKFNVNDFIESPIQISNNEILGFLSKNTKKINSFDENFESKMITKNAASKLCVEKRKRKVT